MPKFVFVYKGGDEPSESEQQAVMTEWETWLVGLGDAIVDMGAPTFDSYTLKADGNAVADTSNSRTTGYTIVQADTVEGAIEMARGCPIFAANGTVEITQVMDMG